VRRRTREDTYCAGVRVSERASGRGGRRGATQGCANCMSKRKVRDSRNEAARFFLSLIGRCYCIFRLKILLLQ
jgi:hypothetical protein